MQKIKIMSDSACDISLEHEKELNIDILCFPITIDGVGYMERETITNLEFYDHLKTCNEQPTTSQITMFRFAEHYKKVFEQGYKELIYVSISSTGSNTYNAAKMARDTFFEENPEIKGKFQIHIVDSLIYTAGYGYPVVEAAKKAIKGVSSDEILAYLEDWFNCVQIYFAPYSLEQVKKSGRVSCAAAFVGELLGLRPLIRFKDGNSDVMEKIRGNKNIIPKIAEIASKLMIPQTPYIVIHGSVPEHAEELSAAMTKKVGYPPAMVSFVGSAVANNCGAEVVAIAFKANQHNENTIQ